MLVDKLTPIRTHSEFYRKIIFFRTKLIFTLEAMLTNAITENRHVVLEMPMHSQRVRFGLMASTPHFSSKMKKEPMQPSMVSATAKSEPIGSLMKLKLKTWTTFGFSRTALHAMQCMPQSIFCVLFSEID